MTMRGYLLVSAICLLVLAMEVPPASTQQSEYPVMDRVAQKVIDKYQSTSCEDLKAKKEQPADPKQDAMKQKVVGMLRAIQRCANSF
jgi:hypothetical protein